MACPYVGEGLNVSPGDFGAGSVCSSDRARGTAHVPSRCGPVPAALAPKLEQPRTDSISFSNLQPLWHVLYRDGRGHARLC